MVLNVMAGGEPPQLARIGIRSRVSFARPCGLAPDRRQADAGSDQGAGPQLAVTHGLRLTQPHVWLTHPMCGLTQPYVWIAKRAAMTARRCAYVNMQRAGQSRLDDEYWRVGQRDLIARDRMERARNILVSGVGLIERKNRRASAAVPGQDHG